MTDKRVSFDFEVLFSNGGGLKGHGFKLDITGDHIADDALANLIIKDLHLLMVGQVNISNKEIVEEPHKRPQLSRDIEKDQGNRFIDLSHIIESGMITYKGFPAPLISDYLSREKSKDLYDEGTSFHIGHIEMVANTGTYLDTPYHRFADGHDLERLDLEKVSNLPGIVVRVAGTEHKAIDWMHFAPYDLRGKAVLVQTDWSENWGTDKYFENHPFLTEDAATYLKDQGVGLVGIDSLNINDTTPLNRPVHTILLGAEIPIVEHLCNLKSLPIDGFRFNAVPPKVKNMGTFPVRAYATIEI